MDEFLPLCNRKETESLNLRLMEILESDPDRDGFVFYDKTGNRQVFKIREIIQLSRRFAAILKEAGLKKGDIICDTLPNSPERVVADIGIFLLGAVMMNSEMVLASGEDLISNVRKAKCKAVIVHSDESNPIYRVIQGLRSSSPDEEPRLLQPINLESLPDLELMIRCARSSCHDDKYKGVGPDFMTLLHQATESYHLEENIPSSETAVIFVTSGSTGYSKLVSHSHLNLGFFIDLGRVKPRIVQLNSRPLGWLGGFPVEVFSPSTRVIFDTLDNDVSPFSGKLLWDIICAEKAMNVVMNSFELYSIVESEADLSLHKPNLIMFGGVSVSADVVKSACNIADAVIVSYGLTEVGHVSMTYCMKNYIDHYVIGRYDTIFIPNTFVKIVDKDGQEVAPGETGELWVKGPSLMTRYAGDEKATEECFSSDGYFKTGDVGHKTESGGLVVLGRVKDVIMMGPVIVYPTFVEEVVRKCPAVQDVMVVAVADPVSFHKICACVVKTSDRSDLTEEELREFCDAQFADIQNRMTPRPDFYVFLSKFPSTTTGKFDRRALKKIAEAEVSKLQ